ncbi:caveolin-3-like [Pomacea canaliculata]|uniref:caveolin-3-like n=1 Tax=Pomacea canaliculata TaxID=400727 RepID=UPI000D730E8A|nr:caveolin-3-like [Pomacea canaliculata]
MGEVNLVNRDENNVNDHIKVCFEDVLAEPDGSHSIDCVWKLSYCCFNCSKGCCYNLLAIFCGIPSALCWGFEFAIIAFYHIWYMTPCLRAYMINCGMMQKYFETCLRCCIGPVCETCGLFFSRITVKNG